MTTQIDELAPMLEAWMETSRSNIILSCDATRSFRLSSAAIRFPKQLLDVGITEGSVFALAHGLAKAGAKVAVIGFSGFLLMRGFEALRSLVAHENSAVWVLGGLAGVSCAHDGYMHQSVEDLALARSAGLGTILTPSDRSSLKRCFEEFANDKGAGYMRLYRLPVSIETKSDVIVGQSLSEIVRHGRDFAMLSYGHMINSCAAAIDLLAERGRRGSLVDVHAPFRVNHDETAKLTAHYSKIFCVEDHISRIGLLGHIQAMAQPANTRQIYGRGVEHPSSLRSGSYSTLLSHLSLNAEALAAWIENSFSEE